MADTTGKVWVYALVEHATLRAIGARDVRTFGDNPDKAQWRISRPPFVNDPGVCMLVIARKPAGVTVAIGRQGMCADIYTEAIVTGVSEDQVDAAVNMIYRSGRVGELAGF